MMVIKKKTAKKKGDGRGRKNCPICGVQVGARLLGQCPGKDGKPCEHVFKKKEDSQTGKAVDGVKGLRAALAFADEKGGVKAARESFTAVETFLAAAGGLAGARLALEQLEKTLGNGQA